MVALIAPPALYMSLPSGEGVHALMVVLIVVPVIFWTACFCRPWYLHGTSSLRLLATLPLVLIWPGWIIVLSCTLSTDCLFFLR